MASPRSHTRISDEAPETPIGRVLRPFQYFARLEAAGGILLLIFAAAGMAWANSPWSATYEAVWNAKLVLSIGGVELMSKHAEVVYWINDGLMVLFFFIVGLEIKREILVGELSSPRRAAGPMFAAFGGMVVPALVFVAFNAGTPGIKGWGVPMATDIAFALGVLALLGKRVPLTLRVFLVSLAIVDDIGALLVIALFYTEELHVRYLVSAGACVGLMILLNAGGVRRTVPFAVLTIVLWVLVLKSGVHATIAGVLAAMTIPVRARFDTLHFLEYARGGLDLFERTGKPGESILTNPEQQGIMDALEHATVQVQTPHQRLEHLLLPYSAFLVVPLFALANAGVPVDAAALSEASTGRLSLGIFFGLLIGKPVGVFGATWLAVKAGWADLPPGVTWRHVFGAGWLAGIGFTMALFIAGLAFYSTPEKLDLAKMSILAASLVAGVIGAVILATGSKREPAS